MSVGVTPGVPVVGLACAGVVMGVTVGVIVGVTGNAVLVGLTVAVAGMIVGVTGDAVLVGLTVAVALAIAVAVVVALLAGVGALVAVGEMAVAVAVVLTAVLVGLAVLTGVAFAVAVRVGCVSAKLFPPHPHQASTAASAASVERRAIMAVCSWCGNRPSARKLTSRATSTYRGAFS